MIWAEFWTKEKGKDILRAAETATLVPEYTVNTCSVLFLKAGPWATPFQREVQRQYAVNKVKRDLFIWKPIRTKTWTSDSSFILSCFWCELIISLLGIHSQGSIFWMSCAVIVPGIVVFWVSGEVENNSLKHDFLVSNIKTDHFYLNKLCWVKKQMGKLIIPVICLNVQTE